MWYVYLPRRCPINGKRRKCQIFFTQFRILLLLIIISLIILIYKVKKMHENAGFSNISPIALKYILSEVKVNTKALDRQFIKSNVNKYNVQEKILNYDTYGPVSKDTTIMVVPVGKYLASLKYLLSTLSQLPGIDKSLIIFSHSYYDENVNLLIKNIDYCRVLQIFYPYSIQLHPHQFPGYEKGKSSLDNNVTIDEAVNYTGAHSPDIYHYRNQYLVEKKHHWWWTANKVFNNLSSTVNHDGLFLFLEDYCLFIEDALHMVLILKKIADSSKYEFVSLGSGNNPWLFNFTDANVYGAEVTDWNPKEDTAVLAFDYSVWNSIVAHYDLYCSVDDHSWSRALYHISLNRRDGKKFKVIRSLMPRAFKILTGPDNSLHDLEILEQVYQVMYLEEQHKKILYPAYVKVHNKTNLENEEYLISGYPKNNGGWNDPQDKAMCTNMTIRKKKKIILKKKHEFQDSRIPEFYYTTITT